MKRPQFAIRHPRLIRNPKSEPVRRLSAPRNFQLPVLLAALVLSSAVMLAAPWPTAGAPSTPPVLSWNYTLLPGSQFVDDCYCGRPTITVPMQGTFQLRWLDENMLFTTYAVSNISFQATVGEKNYQLTGHGLYKTGGEVALVQEMSLTLRINDGFTNRLGYFTNSAGPLGRPWPLLQIHLDQTNGTIMQFFRLDLVAAPFREIWFSTVNGFTPGVQSPYTNHMSAGDLVSSGGRVLKRNGDLTRNLGIQPMVQDLGLDAVDVLPGGEIAFSLEQDDFSERLGPIGHGDLLSDQGRIIRKNRDLLTPFMPMLPFGDVGLDAEQVMDNGEIYFSIETDIFSQKLGVLLRHGDLLSSTGRVVQTNDRLLSRFHPPPIAHDYGLDAIYVWPGEVWFSLEEGFRDDVLGQINPGDLLSDQGTVIYRNLELLAAFQPLEDLADFGLDALYIVNETLTQPATVPCAVEFNPKTGDVTLRWNARSRLFQVEKAVNVLGPYLPTGPLLSAPTFTDYGALQRQSQSFYRLRYW